MCCGLFCLSLVLLCAVFVYDGMLLFDVVVCVVLCWCILLGLRFDLRCLWLILLCCNLVWFGVVWFGLV